MKTCFKCNTEKPFTDFYPHPRMADGYLNKCKECAKKDSKARYQQVRPKRAEYERKRFKDPARKAKILEYQRRRRAKHPEKNRARALVAYHVRKGHIVRKPCEHCGNPKSQAHHADYSKPLEVTWLCFACHREGEHGQTVNKV